MMAASPFSIRTYKQIKPRWPDPELRAEPWYVYRLVLPARVVGPSAAYVHDVMYTDEHWVLEPCEVKKVGRILVQWRAVEASDPVEWWWWA